MTMLRTFWAAVEHVQPGAQGEQPLAGTAEGDIEQRFRRAGLEDVIGGSLLAKADYTGFDDFWEPFTNLARKICPAQPRRRARGRGSDPHDRQRLIRLAKAQCQPVIHTVEVDTSAAAAAREQLTVPSSRPAPARRREGHHLR
jgi:hypothetical protein